MTFITGCLKLIQTLKNSIYFSIYSFSFNFWLFFHSNEQKNTKSLFNSLKYHIHIGYANSTP